jgi:hypothetical protein
MAREARSWPAVIMSEHKSDVFYINIDNWHTIIDITTFIRRNGENLCRKDKATRSCA